MPGWANFEHMQEVIRDSHQHIRNTGGLEVAPQPAKMLGDRVQPIGYWETPQKIAGIVPAWHIIGPFDDAEKKGLDAVFGPEESIDLKGVYQSKHGPVRWNKRLSHGGVVGLGELFGGQPPNVVAYALCTVTSSQQQNAQMRFGSDNDAIVWLNNKEIWRYNGSRGVERDNDIINIVLPAGETQILVKIYNRSGMWAFFMRFTYPDGRPMEGLQFSPAGG